MILVFLKLPLGYLKWIYRNFIELTLKTKILLILLLTLVFAHRVYISNTTSVIYDEAWTYLAFTQKNPLIAACFYPTSNNHILYSHLTQITKFLPFDILFNLRLPSIITGILAIITFFFCTKRYFSEYNLWLSVSLLSFIFPMVYYGVAARGYSMLLLLFIIGFFATIDIIKNPNNYKAYCIIMFSSVLGFYTIPVYLYPCITLNLFLLIFFIINKDYTSLFRIIKFGLLTVIAVLFLYLPVFVVSGVNSVIDNKFVKSKSFHFVADNFLSHLSNTARFFSSIYSDFFALLLVFLMLVFFIVILVFSKNILLKLSLFCIIIIPVFIFIHRLIPVERTWIYLLIPFCFSLGIVANNKLTQIFIFILFVFNMVNIITSYQKQMLWYDKICEEDYIQGKYITNYFINKNVSVISKNRMNTYLKFNKFSKNQNWEIIDEIPENISKEYFLILYNKEKETINTSSFTKLFYYEGYSIYKSE
ncbi:MAG: hypothetical protein IT243_07075 [Bacteroidia bacterium]|nr:hypothetical protein [Bacteroidia bacterium]